MRVFLDSEFTGLVSGAELISIGLISQDGRTFYAELNDYDAKNINDWLRENVITHLRFTEFRSNPRLDLEHHAMKTSRFDVSNALSEWLAQWDKVEIWGDCIAYDWVLFCGLFGGAMKIPSNVYYIPFDIATLFYVRGIDPDISRVEYAGASEAKHNALHDAKIIRSCYLRLNAGESIK